MGSQNSFHVATAGKDCDFLETKDGIKLSKNIIRQMKLDMKDIEDCDFPSMCGPEDADCPNVCNIRRSAPTPSSDQDQPISKIKTVIDKNILVIKTAIERTISCN